MTKKSFLPGTLGSKNSGQVEGMFAQEEPTQDGNILGISHQMVITALKEETYGQGVRFLVINTEKEIAQFQA